MLRPDPTFNEIINGKSYVILAGGILTTITGGLAEEPELIHFYKALHMSKAEGPQLDGSLLRRFV